ncbi:hypothetical protein D3C78_1635770 [compost metagenome]
MLAVDEQAYAQQNQKPGGPQDQQYQPEPALQALAPQQGADTDHQCEERPNP